MFEPPSLTLIRNLLAGTSSAAASAVVVPSSSSSSEPFWNGQTSMAVHRVQLSEFEPSTSAPVQSSGVTASSHFGHWSSYPQIVSPDTPDTQLSESLSRPPSVQILTPPLTLSPSPSSPGGTQQPMSLATRRQIDEFEELIEKIDRLNGMQNDGDDSSRNSPFSSRPSDTPNLTALLVQNNPQLFHDSPVPSSSPLLSSSCRSVLGPPPTQTQNRTRTSSAIDDDFEILLEENPSLLDGPPLSSTSSSMMMMMDTMEMCSRDAATELTRNCNSDCSSMFNNLRAAESFSGGHNGDHRSGQETIVKHESIAEDDEIVECGRKDNSSSSIVPHGFTSPIPTRYFGPPTSLKSATMTTRTNLKQLLQMQQFHEMERKEHSKGAAPGGVSTSPIGGVVLGPGTTGSNTSNCGSSPFSTSTSVNVPMQPILPSRMEVPSEILKVHSQLENPTRYHVQENRKRQVQEYLSTTQGNARSILAQSVPVGAAMNAMGGIGGTGTSAPSMSGNNQAAAVAASTARSPDSPNSVVLSSSAATSVTSEADVIESIMQLESSMDTDHVTYLPQTLTLPTSANFLDVLKMSSAKSCPPDVPVSNLDGMHLTNVQLHAIAKDRQKKDNHNMIERRRRFNINDRIKELGTLLPRSTDPYYDMIRIDRQNKGTILKATVDYVKQMRKELDRVKMELGEKDQENRKLRLQNVQLAALQSHSSGSSGVEVNWPESVSGLANAFTKQELRIKEEPLDSAVDHFHQQVSPFDDLMDEDEPVHGDPLLSSSMLGNTL